MVDAASFMTAYVASLPTQVVASWHHKQYFPPHATESSRPSPRPNVLTMSAMIKQMTHGTFSLWPHCKWIYRHIQLKVSVVIPVKVLWHHGITNNIFHPTRQKVPDQAHAEACCSTVNGMTKQMIYGTFSSWPQCKVTFRRIRRKIPTKPPQKQCDNGWGVDNPKLKLSSYPTQ